MFIPQINEVDVYNGAGRELNDINSITELICEFVMDAYNDNYMEDEDDDSDRHYGLAQPSYNIASVFHLLTHPFLSSHDPGSVTEWRNQFCYPVHSDIVAPPPEC